MSEPKCNDLLSPLVVAAEKYADNYRDDDRQGIVTDVLNAFYAGAKYGHAAERERLRAAILDWWASRRPVGWDAKQHAAHPLVNLGPSDERLALIAAGIEMGVMR